MRVNSTGIFLSRENPAQRSRACGCCGLRRRVFSVKRKYELKTIIPLNSAIATNVCWAGFFLFCLVFQVSAFQISFIQLHFVSFIFQASAFQNFTYSALLFQFLLLKFHFFDFILSVSFFKLPLFNFTYSILFSSF